MSGFLSSVVATVLDVLLHMQLNVVYVAQWVLIFCCASPLRNLSFFTRIQGRTFEEKLTFVSKWMLSHIEDGHYELGKPVFFTEYGFSNLNNDFQHSQRDQFYKTILHIIYKSAKRKRAGAGALVWQFFVEGMEDFNDDFGIVPWEISSTYRSFIEQSCRLAKIQGTLLQNQNFRELCLQSQ